MDAVFSFLDKFNAIAGFISFFLSIFTFLLAFRINKKVKAAEDIAILRFEKPRIVGDLKYYLLNLKAGSYSSEIGDELKASIIDIESRYKTLPREVVKNIKIIHKVIDSGSEDWAEIRKSLNKIITYIERC